MWLAQKPMADPWDVSIAIEPKRFLIAFVT